MTESQKKRGLFVAIEGIDGAGKDTQARLLEAALSACDISCMRIDFPRYEENLGGKLLKECLSGRRGDFVHLDPRLASLPYAIDRLESSDTIRTALLEGRAVIADRFTGSNQIHQGGKFDDEADRVAFLEWLDELEHSLFKTPRPDAVIYLKAPVEVSLELLAQKRAAKNAHLEDGELDQVEKDRQYLDQSHAMAQWLAAREPNWHVVDCVDSTGAVRSREDIHADVLRALVGLVGS